MEGYFYIPKELYVLRMNADGTDAEIEKYDLAKFPELNAWFDESQRFSRNNDCFKEWELVGRKLPDGFTYASNINEHLLDLEGVKAMLKPYIEAYDREH